VVAKRSVQVGARIGPGVALMSVVPLDQIWVDANFKESQLGHIRTGQPVTLTAEVYGDRVVYQGTVVGQDAGTGSAFSLLPAQNATGNWVKVVQRVPVRIALDPQQLARHPLQLGLSMKVSVDTRKRGGSRLALSGNGDAARHTYSTEVFADELASADTLVRDTIRANW
jgi:membrane fusion protein (multidrug efflux system)